MPALLTSTSTFFSACAARCTAAGSDTSTLGEPSTSHTITSAPEALRRLTMAAPIPCMPPVTTAVRPAKSSLFMRTQLYDNRGEVRAHVPIGQGGYIICALPRNSGERSPHGRQAGRQDRFHYGGWAGDRPRRGAGLRARGRQGVGDGSQPEDARR